MVLSSPSNSVSQLLALGPEISEALDPTQLAGLQLPPTPRLAALSLLTSRQSLWEAHVLVVGFAMDNVGSDDPPQVMAQLSSRRGVGEWFENDVFINYTEDQRVDTTPNRLLIASRIIDDAVQRDALHDAQFGTVKINYCRQRCGEDWTCMVQCMNS